LSDDSTIQSILDRPASERLREHKYRFAQCMIFGLPVLALHYFGPKLGGADSSRWTGLLQSLLAGWTLYIGAIPLLTESALLLCSGKLKIDLVISVASVILYILGVVGWIFSLRGANAPVRGAFSFLVIVLVFWSGVQWLWLRRVDRH
jgi:cation transport ATPase